jgi:hypothetical protein
MRGKLGINTLQPVRDKPPQEWGQVPLKKTGLTLSKGYDFDEFALQNSLNLEVLSK